MKKPLATAAIVAAAIALLCAPIAVAGENPQLRPFTGTVAGLVHWEYISDSCPSQGNFRTITVANGPLTHFGFASMWTSHCASADGMLLTDGHAVFTAANGDVMNATYTGHVTGLDPPFLFVGADFHVSGGTGRFENASGDLTCMAWVQMGEVVPDAHWPGEWAFIGQIKY